MGDMGDFWRDVKDHYKRKQARYEKKIAPMVNELIAHPDCKQVGDHWRLGRWDFWWTGTVKDYRTNEHTSIQKLYKEYGTRQPTKSKKKNA